MKILRASAIVGGVTLVVLALISVRTGLAVPAQPSFDVEKPAATSTYAVKGMTCGGCAAAVEHRVGRLEGVRSVQASYRKATAVVAYERGQVSPEAIVEAIESLGYEARLADGEGGR